MATSRALEVLTYVSLTLSCVVGTGCGVKRWTPGPVRPASLASAAVVARDPEPVDGDPCAEAQANLKKLFEIRGPSITVERIAQLVAPIVWLSPDEPLLRLATSELRTDGRPQIPQRLPDSLDPGAGREPTVYFQPSLVSGAVVAGTPRSAEDPERILLDPRNNNDIIVRIRYFFYYEQDYGANPHQHDIEGAEVRLRLMHPPDGSTDHYDLQIRSIVGAAHGMRWSSNQLTVGQTALEDVALPISLLVEEGKHATCPDRNGDGIYSPGYDVNRTLEDAWGVRDNFGSGVLAAAYKADMTKPRRSEHRIFPDAEPALIAYHRCTAVVRWPMPPELAPKYALRRAPEAQAGPPPEPHTVPYLLDKNGFGKRGGGGLSSVGVLDVKGRGFWPVAGAVPGFLWRTVWLGASVGLVRDALDGDMDWRVGTSFMRIPGVGGYMVPAVEIGDHLNAALWYTPSASLWLDWYVGTGWRKRDAGPGSDGPGQYYRHRVEPEFGIKLRFATYELPFLKDILIAADLPKDFANFIGLRVGVRALRGPDGKNWDRLGLTFEIGTGAF
jgi:hypothetical protein